MNYYERHLGDYARDTAHLTMLEHGAYGLLLDRYYATEKGIPVEQVHRVARARTDEEQKAVDVVLQEFFRLDGGLWVHGRVEQEIEKARVRIAAAQSNGKLGGRPRKTQEEPDGFSMGSVSLTQMKALQAPSSKQEKEQKLSDSAIATSGAKPSVSPCPYGEIIELFHQTLPTLPRVREITEERKAKIKARWNNGLHGLDRWKNYFEAVSNRDFLMGRCDPGYGRSKPFVADIDFLIRKSTVVKIAEGKYLG